LRRLSARCTDELLENFLPKAFVQLALSGWAERSCRLAASFAAPSCGAGDAFYLNLLVLRGGAPWSRTSSDAAAGERRRRRDAALVSVLYSSAAAAVASWCYARARAPCSRSSVTRVCSCTFGRPLSRGAALGKDGDTTRVSLVCEQYHFGAAPWRACRLHGAIEGWLSGLLEPSGAGHRFSFDET